MPIQLIYQECGHGFVVNRPSRANARYCSRKCMGLATRGDKGHQWKGGWYERLDGYFARIVERDGKRTSVLQHREVMEKHLDRKLKTSEHVHHLDGDKKNNSIDNPVVLNSSVHVQLHMAGRDRPKGRWATKYDCCIQCGNSTRRHQGHGLCSACYERHKKWATTVVDDTRVSKK